MSSMTARKPLNHHLDEFLELERFFADRADRARREMRAIELGVTDCRVVCFLGETPFAPTAAWLSDRLRLHPGHLSRVLQRLQVSGLVEIVKITDGDTRTKEVELTALGTHLHRELAASERRRAEELLSVLPAAQMERLTEALRTVRSVLRRTSMQNYLDCALEEASRPR